MLSKSIVDIEATSGSRVISGNAGGPQQREYGTTYSTGGLKKINYPGTGNYSLFKYDGLRHLVGITEFSSGTNISTEQFIWSQDRLRRYLPCEQRDGMGNIVKQFYGLGQMNATATYYYEKDHLGSIRELTNNSGALQSDVAYDPFGRAAVINQSITPDFGFTGGYTHQRTGLMLTIYRQYSPSLGRWLSRDPGLARGNAFTYVDNQPINLVDPLGLVASNPNKDKGYEPPEFCVCYSAWCCGMNKGNCLNECNKLYEQKKITWDEYMDCRDCCTAAGIHCNDTIPNPFPGSFFKDCLEKYRGR